MIRGESQQYLGRLIGANMNSTADQAVPISSSKYIIRRVVVTNASANLTLAVGGIYTGASKGGTTIVANTQLYSALTASSKTLDLTLIALTDVLTSTTIYLSLTTAQGLAATADIYLFGDTLD